MRRAWERVYGDFLMPSRLTEYEALLRAALERDYVCTPIGEFWRTVQSGSVSAATRYLILRHDIDTDVGTAAAMWEIEKRLGVRSSYYFRLATLDVELMTRIVAAGSEASYHYEELATIAKQRGLRNAAEIDGSIDAARALFATNLETVRKRTGMTLDVVAAHGDFANRRLGVSNTVLLADRDFRARVGVTLEVYDEELMEHVVSRHSDTDYPEYWRPSPPLEALDAGAAVIYVLVHPRYWRVNRRENFFDDLSRLSDGAAYALRRRARQ